MQRALVLVRREPGALGCEFRQSHRAERGTPARAEASQVRRRSLYSPATRACRTPE
jgi:hypothetical protein